MNGEIYTVSQINQHIKELLNEDSSLHGILIQGEISNYKTYSSGHHYFSLKDSGGTLSCVMFRSYASKLRFLPENGMKVIAFGSISVYPRDGKYQLYCEQLMPDGLGELYVAFEQMKNRLEKEGLFAQEHKVPIPSCPNTIAIITSPSGAALHDMLRILNARWPMAKVKLMGVRVQGKEAPAELAGAVRYANRWKIADLIIIGRGGGSMEDLWAFNDEKLARTIYDSEIPVISAVGHETDYVITDFVADLRAATPSNAAELAVPDQTEVSSSLAEKRKRLNAAMSHLLKDYRQRLDRCTRSRQLTDPQIYLQDRQQRLDMLEREMVQCYQHILTRKKQRLGSASAALDAMSPLKVLGRGYSMTTLEDGTLVTSAGQVDVGTEVNVTLQQGSLSCTVTERSLT